MRDRRYEFGTAHPLGAIRATEQFLVSDPPTAGEVAALEHAVDTLLGPVLEEIAANGLPLVAMGGTVRNLARAVQRRGDYRVPRFQNT